MTNSNSQSSLATCIPMHLTNSHLQSSLALLHMHKSYTWLTLLPDSQKDHWPLLHMCDSYMYLTIQTEPFARYHGLIVTDVDRILVIHNFWSILPWGMPPSVFSYSAVFYKADEDEPGQKVNFYVPGFDSTLSNFHGFLHRWWREAGGLCKCCLII